MDTAGPVATAAAISVDTGAADNVTSDNTLSFSGTAEANSTVTVVHTRTKDLAAHCLRADILIVVDISTPLHPPEALSNPLIITDQLTSIMTRSNTERNLATLSSRDILIVPDLGHVHGQHRLGPEHPAQLDRLV